MITNFFVSKNILDLNNFIPIPDAEPLLHNDALWYTLAGGTSLSFFSHSILLQQNGDFSTFKHQQSFTGSYPVFPPNTI